MPVVIVLLVLMAGGALGYAVVVNAAFRAILKGVAPDVTALRLLPGPVRRHAHARLLPVQREGLRDAEPEQAGTVFAATATMLRSEAALMAPPELAQPIAPVRPDPDEAIDEAIEEAWVEPDRWHAPESVPSPDRELYSGAPPRGRSRRRARGRPALRPPRKQRAAARGLSRQRRRQIHRAVRGAARRDAPLWLKFFSAFRLMALLTLITLAISAVVWLTVAYAVSIVSQTIQGG